MYWYWRPKLYFASITWTSRTLILLVYVDSALGNHSRLRVETSMRIVIRSVIDLNHILVPFFSRGWWLWTWRECSIHCLHRIVMPNQSFTIQINSYRLESRDKYTRSKSPNIFNRKTIEVSTPAVTKASQPEPKQQRARTASMPGENRKVREIERQLFIRYHQPVVLMDANAHEVILEKGTSLIHLRNARKSHPSSFIAVNHFEAKAFLC